MGTVETLTVAFVTVILYFASNFTLISSFLVLVVREYFKIINKILVKNSAKKILKIHLEITKFISSFNKIFTVNLGFFLYLNLLVTTFAIYEVYDVLTSINRSTSQVVISFGFFFSNILYYSMIQTFLFCCNSAWNEQQKSFRAIGRKKILKGSKQNLMAMLQFQSTEIKFSLGLFELDLKYFNAVS